MAGTGGETKGKCLLVRRKTMRRFVAERVFICFSHE